MRPRRILAIVLAWPIALACLGCVTFEATYLDSSGARCAAFSLGNREADLCTGAMDRPMGPGEVQP